MTNIAKNKNLLVSLYQDKLLPIFYAFISNYKGIVTGIHDIMKQLM